MSKDDLITHDLDKLADRLCPPPQLEIAFLRAEERAGKRIGNTIRVSIPFHGDIRTFQIKPSRFSLPSASAEVDDKLLIVSFPDDQNIDQNVNGFIEIMNRNIESLRVE